MHNETIRVGSFNIRFGTARDGLHSWIFRRFATIKTIQNIDCTILGLQEAHNFQVKYLLSEMKHFEALGEARDGASIGEHCSILYDSNSLIASDVETKWYGPTPDIPTKLEGTSLPRIYTHALFTLSGNKKINVFNTHLDHASNERRAISMKQLLKAVDASVPTIITGDFNAKRDNVIFDQITDHGLHFAAKEPTIGTFQSFGRAKNPSTIDHILVSDHFEVLNYSVIAKRVFGVFPSDHWPIVTELRLR